ncbi:hypothetical protein RI578_06405 [Streptomyces sp. BB1-1-1]|uniref:hypothetical protein n=1 Tax=Streptomyces sp. BB1-1-1 TaxID=3074430 RepID=UPI002877FA39|nr:hypothetical protein [Streptomyces sp. BB1-1-1]WND33944.1 hypothetical protein RI578_06405 [Streptomyces sp. BB1-1-1]
MANAADEHVSLAGYGSFVGTARSAVTGGACLVDVAGIRITARVIAGLTVAPGDSLLIARSLSTYFVQAVLQANPNTPPTPPEQGPDETAETPSGDDAPDPKPTITGGTLLVLPVATSTWRDGRWRTDIGPSTNADLYQGRYGGSSYGRSHGFAFYGSRPRSIEGATVTKATLRLRRMRGGDFAARAPTLRLVTQSTRPTGFPTLNETGAGPRLAVDKSVNHFEIPKSWAQAMVDGTRGGIAISIGSDSPYMKFAGRGSWSAAWALTISWRRGS